ncbi:DNA starvation/stationary phase protection protein [Roseibium polysiphoniae]|uniref:DNA starvation/stationary phase protection protein n=1 Tax=Roseibium polysiphoniae TaxID=2571221 RepID=A0A944CDS1_9HYPH|nr:DNA starvation/stationary phase protection protein [Roseibium polysiphoniae]MBD8876621.1 DNA starvation/stationary phase protection protein [Roseibium polysiphoniae]MBS8260073.1 DNA starvation/stationary phase protection protein [Roseibium polysiphoniae]
MANTNVLNVTTKKSEKVNTGIEKDVREQIAKHLSVILADTYLLVIKSHLYHWNVVGPLFKSIHDLTEEHYEDMFAAADDIAERIRALGHRAPVNAAEISMDLKIVTPQNGMPNAHSMVEDLVKSHERIAAEMRDMAEYAGDNADVVTEDMLTARIAFHEKAAWMLRALIAE